MQLLREFLVLEVFLKFLLTCSPRSLSKESVCVFGLSWESELWEIWEVLAPIYSVLGSLWWWHVCFNNCATVLVFWLHMWIHWISIFQIWHMIDCLGAKETMMSQLGTWCHYWPRFEFLIWIQRRFELSCQHKFEYRDDKELIGIGFIFFRNSFILGNGIFHVEKEYSFLEK